MTVLYDQFGRPLQSAGKKPGQNERASLPIAPMLDSTRDYVADGLTPERLATVFKEADRGEMRSQAQLFEQLEERDGHMLCERDKRRNVILDMDFTVTPASDDARDVEVAEFVETVLDEMPDWDDTLVCMQDAVGKGYAPLEIFWDISEGQAVLDGFDFIEQSRLLFTNPSGRLSRIPRLLTDETPMGEEIPPWKMVLHVYGGKSGHPTRSAIFRVAAWMVLYKHYSIKDWLTFGELFGMPLRLGKYDAGASDDERRALVNAVRALGVDAAGVISKSTEIEFIDNAKTGRGDLWGALTNLCNSEISKAILGQTLTTETGDTGSYALGKVHDGVRLALMRADGRAIASTVRQQLIRPLVGFNFGWDAQLPHYEASFGEQEDRGSKAEWMSKLLVSGVSMPRSFVDRSFNIPKPEDGEEMVSFAQPVSVPGAVGTAAKQPATIVAKSEAVQDETATAATLAALSEATRRELDLAPLMAPAAKLLAETQSLPEFRAGLQQLYVDLDVSELATAMAKAMSLAQLSGRFDINAEISEQGDD